MKMKRKHIWRIVLASASVSAGIGLMIMPESATLLLIRGIGFLWMLEGISWVLSVINEKKREEQLKEVEKLIETFKQKTK